MKTPSGQEAMSGGLCGRVDVAMCLSEHVCDGLSLQPPCWTVEGGVGGN